MPESPLFSINRNLGVGFADQIVECVRALVSSGRLKPGDALPSRDRLAKELGVSVRVVREAMATLVAESIVGVRPRVGCTVLSSRAKFWRKRVLVVVPAAFQVSFYCGALLMGLQRKLTAEGCMLDILVLDILGKNVLNTDLLDEALRLPPDFAIVLHDDAAVLGKLVAAKVPFAAVDSKMSKAAAIVFSSNMETAFRAVVANCVARKVHSVSVFGYGVFPSFVEDLMRADIFVETLSVPDSFGPRFLECIQERALRLSIRRLKNPKNWPDLVVVTDDFVARGVLTAMSELGLSAPRDFGLIIWKNRGFGPVYPRTMARLESDPFLNAERLASAVLHWLRRRGGPVRVEFPVVYRSGQTFA